jgi:hypothetical protein
MWLRSPDEPVMAGNVKQSTRSRQCTLGYRRSLKYFFFSSTGLESSARHSFIHEHSPTRLPDTPARDTIWHPTNWYPSCKIVSFFMDYGATYEVVARKLPRRTI